MVADRTGERSALRRTAAVHGSYADVLTAAGAVRPMLARGDDVVLVLTGPGPVDAALLDVLAQLALSARRSGGALSVRADGPQLRQLAELVGLNEVIGLAGEGPEDVTSEA